MTPAKPYTVSELIRQINMDLFRYADVAVEGEVSNFTRSTAGHLYFSIKDAKAQMRVVLFATNARFLRFRIENGLQLIVRGRLTIYEQKGEFQLSAVSAEPAGLGALQLAFEQLKKRLAEEGLFDAARKRAIPMLPQRIAVVTSPSGAAIRDILNVIGRRFEGLSLQIYPVRVQGATAGREIATALRHLSRWKLHDVVLIVRGGGSLEDLWAFNEEVVARAVAASEIPTISGVGHETDFTIADFVADVRAATPSAAAEIVIQAKSEICTRVAFATDRIRRHVAYRIRDMRAQLDARRHGLDRLLRRQAERMRTRLARLEQPLHRVPERLAVRVKAQRVAMLEDKLIRVVRNNVAWRRDALASRVGTLEAVSPLSVLSRGYAIAFQRRGRKRVPVQDSMAVKVGEAIEVQLKKGRLECTVDRHSLGLETVWPAELRNSSRAKTRDQRSSRDPVRDE